MGPRFVALPSLFLTLCFHCGWSTWRYYNSYVSYGTGDTMIQTYHYEGGSTEPHRKWNIECLDGEAVVGVSDWYDDFARLEVIWCKFMFPFKPPSGSYPYYSSCHTRNLTDQWYCYNPQNASATVNTFVTGFYTNFYVFAVFRVPGGDAIQPYKCCKTPPGYYIDYVSCYYMPTHDLDFEYYDSTFHIIVFCATGYVTTGASKKRNPYTKEMLVDWIQCCRVGYGKPYNVPPPIIYSDSGAASYYAPGGSVPSAVNPSYSAQYRTIKNDQDEIHSTDTGVSNPIPHNDARPNALEMNASERPELRGAIAPVFRSRNQNPSRPYLPGGPRPYL